MSEQELKALLAKAWLEGEQHETKKNRELRENVIGSLQALCAVVELHKNHGESWSVSGELRPTSNTCEECGIEFPYPCPTIQAIEKELK